MRYYIIDYNINLLFSKSGLLFLNVDGDCLQVFAARVRVDGVAKVAELEVAEKEKMKAKVNKILKHDINVFINRFSRLAHWLILFYEVLH